MEQPYGCNSYSKYIHMLTRGGALKNRSLDTYVLNGWPQTNVVKYFLCIGPAKYTKASLPAGKMPLFSSIIITIILSYAIIRIYTILHIYLQISETERLAELHRVIQLSLLEKINSIYFKGISLVLSRMFFQNPNVLSRIQMFLMSRLYK